MATPDNPPSPPPGPVPGQQPPKGSEPRPRRVRTPREFNAQLVNLRTGKGLTLEELNKRSQGRLPKSTVSNNLNKNTLPARDFVERYVRACGGDEAEAARWLSLWQTLNTPVSPAPWRRIAADFAGTLRSLWGSPRRGSLRVVIVVVLVVVLAAPVVVWWSAAQHCNTTNSDLITVENDECVGVTDGTDGAGVFGAELESVMKKIAEENEEAVKDGRYVTIAFLGPLTSKPGVRDFIGGRSLHELEGAFVAQKAANASGNPLKVRLVLANEGNDERHWKSTVDTLKKMTDAPHRLVAVAGMGLSQQESLDAARLLAAEPALPMVADIITADGFNGLKVRGLRRVAPDVSIQLKVISRELAGRKPQSAVLVQSKITLNGSEDLYTISLADAFEKSENGFKRYIDRGKTIPYTPKGGNFESQLGQIAASICGPDRPDMVLWASRANDLDDFFEALDRHSCSPPAGKKILVVTASDAAALPADLLTKYPFLEMVYVPLADPKQLEAVDNPNRKSYLKFKEVFLREKFPEKDLDTGWAIMAHDAVTTLTTVIGRASSNPGTGKNVIPDIDDVNGQLDQLNCGNRIAGAGDHFGINFKTGNRLGGRELKTIYRPEGTQSPQNTQSSEPDPENFCS